MVVGWVLIGLAASTAIFCYVRDVRSGIWGCLTVAVVGWSFVSGAKPKEEEGPKRVRWYHLVFAVVSIVAGLLYGHFYL